MKQSTFKQNPYKKLRVAISIEKLNNLIDHGKTKKIVQICEGNYHKQVKELVKDVLSCPNKSIINVAGPTSSGKTTTASNIKRYLEEKGKKAIIVSLDNFLKPLRERDLLENGEIDYETINTLDHTLLQNFLSDLINKKTAMMPEYDFAKGDRKKKRVRINMSKDDYIIIEGLHALNPVLIGSNYEYVYKVYICPYKDYYYQNKLVLPAKELRLMRRCIRDFYNRGSTLDEVIHMWETIKDSEYVYIKPFKFNCDYFINSTIDYELCLYATYLKPMLEKVKDEQSTWDLFEVLDKMAKLENDIIPDDSLLWEFLKKN